MSLNSYPEMSLPEQLFRCKSVWMAVQTVFCLNSRSDRRLSEQTFRQTQVWTAVQTVLCLNGRSDRLSSKRYIIYNSATRVKGTLSFGDQTLTIDWKNERLCLPINLENSGHFHLQFYPMSQVEESHLTREFVHRAEWTKEEIQKVVAYVALEKNLKWRKSKSQEN